MLVSIIRVAFDFWKQYIIWIKNESSRNGSFAIKIELETTQKQTWRSVITITIYCLSYNFVFLLLIKNIPPTNGLSPYNHVLKYRHKYANGNSVS